MDAKFGLIFGSFSYGVDIYFHTGYHADFDLYRWKKFTWNEKKE